MNIIQKPIVTEKLNLQGEKLEKYGFIVVVAANKLQIKAAVESMYGVTVTSINTARYAGKSKTRYTKTGVTRGRSESFKKAYVTLKKGDKIDFYSNI